MIEKSAFSLHVYLKNIPALLNATSECVMKNTACSIASALCCYYNNPAIIIVMKYLRMKLRVAVMIKQ